MPGVGPAAVADDDLRVLGQDVYDLALPLITPLQTNDAGIALQKRRHALMPFRWKPAENRGG